ncbi:hypothetical protein ACFO5V_01335 [Enterococcus aquimarinus]
MIEEEFENYRWYLNSYFPYTKISKNIDTVEFKEIFNNTLSLSKACQCLSSSDELNKYTSIIEYNLNNLLYFIPLNEMVSINVSIRNCVEYILKLIYFLENPSEDTITKGYRTMKDNKDKLKIFEENKNKVENTFRIYSERSNKVHLKSIPEGTLRSLLEKKLTKEYEKSDMNEIKHDIKHCFDFMLEIICFYEISLSTQQKLVMSKIVSNKWKTRIFNLK